MSVSLLPGSTGKGEPHITARNCGFNIGNFDVKFHGGASFLYNLFSHDIGNAIKGALDKQVRTFGINIQPCESVALTRPFSGLSLGGE